MESKGLEAESKVMGYTANGCSPYFCLHAPNLPLSLSLLPFWIPLKHLNRRIRMEANKPQTDALSYHKYNVRVFNSYQLWLSLKYIPQHHLLTTTSITVRFSWMLLTIAITSNALSILIKLSPLSHTGCWCNSQQKNISTVAIMETCKSIN